MVARKKRPARTKATPRKKAPAKKPAAGGAGSANGKAQKTLFIPPLEMGVMKLRLVGDSALLVNNKAAVVEELAERYGPEGGAGKTIKRNKRSYDEQFLGSFYVTSDTKYAPPHPKATYGIPTTGVKKCAVSAIRQTGITSTSDIGLISRAFFIPSGPDGLTPIKFKQIKRDIGVVSEGQQKKVPAYRHRGAFYGWSCDITIKYNAKILSPEQIVNLFMHAGVYIGLCERRAEKKIGDYGGFYVEAI